MISILQLSQPTGITAELVEDVVNYKWNDISGSITRIGTDKALMVVYNTNNHELSYSMCQVTSTS